MLWQVTSVSFPRAKSSILSQYYSLGNYKEPDQLKCMWTHRQENGYKNLPCNIMYTTEYKLTYQCCCGMQGALRPTPDPTVCEVWTSLSQISCDDPSPCQHIHRLHIWSLVIYRGTAERSISNTHGHNWHHLGQFDIWEAIEVAFRSKLSHFTLQWLPFSLILNYSCCHLLPFSHHFSH